MKKSEKEMSMGEYLSYLSTYETRDEFEELVRPRIATWPKEWTEYFLCYRDPKDPTRCYTDLNTSEFCEGRVKIE